MSLTAKKVLDRVEELGMLEPKVIEDLRRQVAESKFSVSAEAIVKVLVDKKHLTQFQAKKLVAEVTTEPEPTPAKREAAPPGSTKSPSKPAPKAATADEDDLLANFGDTPAPAPAAPASSEDDDIVDLESALPPSQPLKAEVKPLTPNKSAPKKPASKPGATPPSAKPAPALEPLTPKPSAKPALQPLQPNPPAPALTPLAPQPTPGLTPLSGLTPMGPTAPAPTPGLTPLTPGLSPMTPGLSPIGGPAAPPPPLAPLGGLGDPLMGGALGGMGPGLGALGPPPPPKEEPKPGVQKRLARGWDSPLLLIGGGGLGVLIIAFLVLYIALTRGSAQELLAEANEKYSGGQYATAISLYEKFKAKYPDDAENVSLSNVKIGAAMIHQSYDGAKDMSRALEAAERELPKMETENAFNEIRGELESILPTIADNFATNAREATDLKRMEAQVALAHSAMKLVNNASYLPTDRRATQQARIDAIQEKIRVAERTINQGKALADAMTALQGKLTSNEIAAAYDIRARLLQDYPTLENHPDVVKNTVAISQRERDLVTTTPQTQAAATDDPHAPAGRQLTLVSRSGNPIGAPADATAFLLVRGSVYAIEVASGKLRWRRFVGAETKIPPLTLTGGDVIVGDEVHRDVLRLAGASGKVVWRQSFGERFASPQVLGDFLFVTLESGRVVRLNAANGELDRAAQLPQPTSVGAGADARGKVIFQPAEHSTLYALAADDSTGEPLSCRAAHYLGHPPGSIAVAPIVVVGYVFVFQNEGASSSLMHALAVNKDGGLERAREPIRLRGRVTVPPISLRSRLIAVTDLGDVLVADVDPGNSSSPVNITAQHAGGLSQPTIGYPAVSGSRLFVADTSLVEYEIVATRQALDSKQSKFSGDVFVSPLQLFGTTLIHARQRHGAQSVTVTGVNLADDKSWQLVLSSPVVGVNAYPEQKQFAAVSSDGDLFEVGVDTFKEGTRDQPTTTAAGAAAQSFGNAVTMPENKSLLVDRSGKSWALQEARAGGGIQRVNLQAPGGNVISARPVAFGGGILAPLSGGSMWLLDAATGAPLGDTTPFQPETPPGAKVKWLPPLAVDERQFVAIDAARKTIYLARREEKPSPFLAQTRPLEVDYEPVSAAVLGKTLLVVARGAAEDELVSLSLPQLQEVKRLKIEGRVGLRGLNAAGEFACCETSSDELLKIAADLTITARVKLADSPLVAGPLLTGNEWIVVAQNGKVLRLNGEGELKLLTNAGQPLSGAVQLLGSNLVAGGADGTLHILSLSGAN
jgi:hypothetical protein